MIITFYFPSSHTVPASVGGFSFCSHERNIFGVFHVLAELSPMKSDWNSRDYRLIMYLLLLLVIILCTSELVHCCKEQNTLQHACVVSCTFFSRTQLHYCSTPTPFLARLAAFVNLAGLACNTRSQPCQSETMHLNSSSNSTFNFISSLHCSFFLVYITDNSHEWYITDTNHERLLRIFGQVIDLQLVKTLPDTKLSREWIRFRDLEQCYLCHRSDLITFNTSCPARLLLSMHCSLLDRSEPWDAGFTLSFD